MRNHRDDIDGLRAFAVGGVLLFHAFPLAFPAGFLGVDVFFVISGYLITGILMRAVLEGRFSLREFYYARVRRIFPALLLVLIFVMVVGWFYLLPEEFSQLGRHIAGGGAFLANVVYLREFGYFDEEAARKPLLHLWSLGVEEQFYIVFPVLLYAAYTLTRSVAFVFFVVLMLALALAVGVHRGDMVAQFYSPFSRAWQLGAGVLLALSQMRSLQSHAVENPSAARYSWLSAVGFLFIMAALTGGTDFEVLSRVPGLFPVIGTVLIIHGGAAGWVNSRLLSLRPIVWLGQISYPVYLWHWPLFAFAYVLTGRHPDVLLGCGLLLSSIMLGWGTARWVESPIRRSTAGATPLVLMTAMAVMVMLGLWINARDGVPERSVPKGQLIEFEYGQHWQGWADCDAIKADPALGGCKRLHPDLPAEVAIVGDSHAGHLASGLRSRYAERRIGISIMLHAGCFPALPVEMSGRRFFDCPDDAISQAVRHAVENPSIKVVVLVGYAALQVHGARLHEKSKISDAEKIIRLEAIDLGLRQVIEKLLGAKKKVIFVIDNHELMVDPKACLERAYPFGKTECEIDVSLKQTRDRNSEFDALRERHKKAFPSVVDFSARDVFCKVDTCHGKGNDELWFASRDHLTPAGSRRVADGLVPVIDAALKAD